MLSDSRKKSIELIKNNKFVRFLLSIGLYGFMFTESLFDPDLMKDITSREERTGLLKGTILQNPLWFPNEDNLELNLSLLSRYFPDEFLGLHPLQSIGVPICDEHQEGEKHHVRFHIILKGRGSKHESRVFSYIQPQSIREKTFKLPFMVWYRGYGINAVGPPEDRLSRERIVRVTTYLEATFGSQGLAERLKLRVHAFRE